MTFGAETSAQQSRQRLQEAQPMNNHCDGDVSVPLWYTACMAASCAFYIVPGLVWLHYGMYRLMHSCRARRHFLGSELLGCAGRLDLCISFVVIAVMSTLADAARMENVLIRIIDVRRPVQCTIRQPIVAQLTVQRSLISSCVGVDAAYGWYNWLFLVDVCQHDINFYWLHYDCGLHLVILVAASRSPRGESHIHELCTRGAACAHCDRVLPLICSTRRIGRIEWTDIFCITRCGMS